MRKVKIEYVDIDRLKEWENNLRINDEASKKLSKLIKYYGFINPIEINRDHPIFLINNLKNHGMVLQSKDNFINPKGFLFAKKDF